MKKALVAIWTVVVVLLVGIGVFIYIDSRPKPQSETQESALTTEPEPEPTKYEVGPPDPQEILELINVERLKVGVAPLIMDENVRISAQLKVDDMVARNYFDHYLPGTNYTLSPEMNSYVQMSCSSSGENLYRAISRQLDNTSYDVIYSGWMESEPHKKAILDPKYSKIGIAFNDTKVVAHFCIAK